MKLYISVDFFDEMLYAVWTPEMLLSYFRLMKSKNISRVYWIDQKEINMYCGKKGLENSMRQTWKNFGGNVTGEAVKLAHQAGLEIFVIIKPYDMGICSTYSEDADLQRSLPVAGDRMFMFTDFAMEHPELMYRREAAAVNQAEKIILSFDAPLKEDILIRVWGSDTNKNYRLLREIPAAAGASEAEFICSGEKFYVFTCKADGVGNQLGKLIKAVDKSGDMVPFSLAVTTRRFYVDITDHLDFKGKRGAESDFVRNGMQFDYWPGIPSSLFSAEELKSRPLFFAELTENAVGVSTELNDRIPGCPDMRNRGFQEFVKEWVKDDLALGFDGVDIRISNHNSPIFWDEYGTGSAVRKARGEAHTALLKELSAIVRGSGRTFALHIPNMMFDLSPEKSCPQECFWDYKAWISEKLMDEVTAKLILTDGFSPRSIELMELCRNAGIGVNYCPFIHAAVLSDPAGYAARAAGLGVEAFNIYEAASIWSYREGDFIEIRPERSAGIWQIR